MVLECSAYGIPVNHKTSWFTAQAQNRPLIVPALSFNVFKVNLYPIVLYFQCLTSVAFSVELPPGREGGLIYSELFGAQWNITKPSNAWLALSERLCILSLWPWFYIGRRRVQQHKIPLYQFNRREVKEWTKSRTGLPLLTTNLLEKRNLLINVHRKEVELCCYSSTVWGLILLLALFALQNPLPVNVLLS